LGLEDKFMVIYAGLMGLAQALSSVLDAVEQVQKVDPDIHFLFVGDGPVKGDLVSQAERSQLVNVTFIPAQPREQVPAYLSAADAALIPLIRQQLVGALPSKMFDAMACERPILLSAKGEALSVLRQEQVGISVPPETPDLLCHAILQLKRDPDQACQYGLRGRRAVVERYSRQAQARQLEQLLRNIVE
jgi:glycosyltransferase involved in cell wall biosynthesis